jgi:hypothetical protein
LELMMSLSRVKTPMTSLRELMPAGQKRQAIDSDEPSGSQKWHSACQKHEKRISHSYHWTYAFQRIEKQKTGRLT